MTEITIPVEGVKLDGNTVYKLKGLEASMTYEVTLTSDKFVNLEITEDEDEQAKVLAFDSTLTASGGSPILDNVAGVKDDTGSLFAAPLEAGVVKGVRDMRGSIIYSAPGALSQPLILATYKTATGSNGWSGKAVISYLGPIS